MSEFLSTDADDWFERNKTKLSKRFDVIDQKLMTCFSKFINSDTRFLEIGCGDGSRTEKIGIEFGCSVFGIDLSPLAISSGKLSYCKTNLTQGDASNLPYNNNYFDFVYLGFFLYLVDRRKYLKVLSEADRVVKEGGYLGILDFDVPFNYSNTYEPNPLIRSYKMDNSKVFCASGLYTLLEKSTFEHNDPAAGGDFNERISIQIMRKENAF